MKSIDRTNAAAIRTLCSLVADGMLQIRGNTVSDAVLQLLKAWGAVREIGSAETVWCNECDLGHLAAVTQNPAGDDLGWVCPEAGFVSAKAHELRAFKIELDKIAESLSDDFTTPGSFDNLCGSTGVWRLGQRAIKNGRAEILLVSRMRNRDDADTLAHAAKHLPPAHLKIMLIAEGSDETVEQVNGWFSYPLSELLDARGSKLRIDAEEFDLSVSALLLRSPLAKAGRPSQKEMTRQALKWLDSHSMWEEGRNATVRQLQRFWPAIFGGEAAPPSSTLEKHVTSIRGKDASRAKWR